MTPTRAHTHPWGEQRENLLRLLPDRSLERLRPGHPLVQQAGHVDRVPASLAEAALQKGAPPGGGAQHRPVTGELPCPGR